MYCKDAEFRTLVTDVNDIIKYNKTDNEESNAGI